MDLRDFFRQARQNADKDLPCQQFPELYFSPNLADTEKAKDLCWDCPMIRDCLAGAKDRKEPTGVWGGEWFENGVPATRRRPGRPTGSANKAKATLPVIPSPAPAPDDTIGQPTIDGSEARPGRIKKINYPDTRRPPRRLPKASFLTLF